MKKENFFKKFYNNLFNLNTFPAYIKEGLGRAILYALILNIFIGVFQGVLVAVDFNKNINQSKQYLLDDKYDFKIENGLLTMKTTPIKISEGSTLVYVDSNKSLDERDSLRSISVHGDMSMLILKDGVALITPDGEQTLLYKDITLDTITNEDMIQAIGYIEKTTPIIIIIVSVIAGFIDYLINCLIVAAFAMITNFVMGLKIKFSGIFSLSIYAATLPTILILIIGSVVRNVYFNQVALMATLVYVILILRNIRKEIFQSKN